MEYIKNNISTFFRNNNMLLRKLPQVYILYRALQKIGKEPILVKGYLVNHFVRVYYISFWIVCEDQMHNIVDETLTYSLDCNTELVETLSLEIEREYLNMDINPSAIEHSFHEYMQGRFLDDLYKTTPTNIYNKIERFYNEMALC